MGHSVLEAANGLEALHMVRVLSSKIEVVLSDAVMPLMNRDRAGGDPDGRVSRPPRYPDLRLPAGGT